MRTTKRPVGTAENFAVGDRARKVEGVSDLGREGVVTRIQPTYGGDVLAELDGSWTAYTRQLEKVKS